MEEVQMDGPFADPGDIVDKIFEFEAIGRATAIIAVALARSLLREIRRFGVYSVRCIQSGPVRIV